MSGKTDFALMLSQFFTSRLIDQRQVSAHTIASYKDTFRLLVLYAKDMLHKAPQELSISDLSVQLVVRFLNHLEQQRGNSARTRNVRLAAIRSFFRYVALQEPTYAFVAQQILALPVKQTVTEIVDFLDIEEIEALLEAPDLSSHIGRRDHALMLVAVQTGMRASEIIGLRREDVQLDRGAHVRCFGKGRKRRCIPLRADSVAALKDWLEERSGEPAGALFLNQRGRPLTHDSLDYLLKKNLALARQKCPTLRTKRVTPHTLRHTAAMMLLKSGVDRATIALWLGHEQIETTYVYLHADLKLKEQAMAKTAPLDMPFKTFQPEDAVLEMLSKL